MLCDVREIVPAKNLVVTSSIATMLQQTDNSLFRKVLSNSQRLIQQYLPERPELVYLFRSEIELITIVSFSKTDNAMNDIVQDSC